MSIIAGAAIGAAAGIAATIVPRKIFSNDKKRPPHLHEFFADNFWFDSVDLYGQTFNKPLKGKEKADIVISPYPSDHRAVVSTFTIKN